MERGVRLQEQIVIGTPGTVLDWCQKLKFIDPKKIKVFVLDEADVMIATQGHQDHSIRIQRCVFAQFICTFGRVSYNVMNYSVSMHKMSCTMDMTFCLKQQMVQNGFKLL